MSFTGVVENGVIRLPEGIDVPDGAQVTVDLVLPPTSVHEQGATLYEQFAPFIGSLKDLPPDLALNHDHYLYGAPKQQP